ncbi:hypothetical protein GCM10010360_54660 [Streptomyces nogalater]
MGFDAGQAAAGGGGGDGLTGSGVEDAQHGASVGRAGGRMQQLAPIPDSVPGYGGNPRPPE